MDHVVLILVGILLAPLQILAAPFFLGYILFSTALKPVSSPPSL